MLAFLDGETVFLHNEISSIIDRLSSPSKNKHSNIDQQLPKNVTVNNSQNANIDTNFNTDTQATNTNEQIPIIENQQDFIEEMQTDTNTITVETITSFDVDKYRQMIPYNTTDPEKINQQESILELLISNGICDDETFRIFIAEPDLHKEKASQILDSLYCVNTMMPVEYENDAGAIEWIDMAESMPIAQISDSIAIVSGTVGDIATTTIETAHTSTIILSDVAILDNTTTQSDASSELF